MRSSAAQIPGPRDAELIDLVVDAIGIISGLGFIAMFDARYRSFPLAIITVLALVVAAGPTLFYGYAWISQQRAAPTLLSFEHRWERPIFGQPGPHHPDMLPAPPGWPLEGTVALAEETDRGRALVRVTPYPDWTGYSALSFIAASGSGMPTKIRVSIVDIRPTDESDTNRFRENFDIGAQPTRITIPLDKLREISNGRPFDLAHIEAIFLNAVEPGSDTSVYLDDFRLE